MKIVVAGASGYIGSQMVKFLLEKGHEDIVAVSSRPLTHGPGVINLIGDLKDFDTCNFVMSGADVVFNFAARVGGIGHISGNQTDCLLSSLINTNLLLAAEANKVKNYFFASSSCVYPPERGDFPFKEEDAYPANPMQGYGWEKLFSERMCQAFRAERNVPTTIARLHGVYGPGDFRDAGKDHVIQALCQKVVDAKLSGKHEITVWGDGTQTRSFLYIDDAIEGIYRLTNGSVPGPVNLANSEVVSVDDLVSLLEKISGIPLQRFYNVSGPTGRQHKTSDNSALRKALNWEPMTPIEDGLRAAYRATWERAVIGRKGG